MYVKINKYMPQYDIDPQIYTKDWWVHLLGQKLETKASQALEGFEENDYVDKETE